MHEVTAVLCGNDPMALGLLRALAECGRRVPGDVSVVGFDDVPEAAFFLPPLTTVRQDFGELGRRALHLLLDRISDEHAPRPTLPKEPALVVRVRAQARPVAASCADGSGDLAVPAIGLAPADRLRQNEVVSVNNGPGGYVVGVDFGTLSGRALVVRVADGAELGTAVHEYRHGVMDTVAGPLGQAAPARLGAAGPRGLPGRAPAGRARRGGRRRH